MDIAKLIDELDAITARIAHIRLSLTEAAPKPALQAAERVAANLCTYCGDPIGKKRSNRGAHEACYRKAMRHIERGWITDAQLIAQGLLLPHAKQGRKQDPNDPVVQQMQAATKEDVADAVKAVLKKNRTK